MKGVDRDLDCILVRVISRCRSQQCGSHWIRHDKERFGAARSLGGTGVRQCPSFVLYARLLFVGFPAQVSASGFSANSSSPWLGGK